MATKSGWETIFASRTKLRSDADAMVDRVSCRIYQTTVRLCLSSTKARARFEHGNVATQRRDPNSLLNWMERMIRMRKEVPEISWGDFSFVRTRNPEILAMRYDWRNNAVLFVHNLHPEPREVRFSVDYEAKMIAYWLLFYPMITATRKRATGTAS